MRQETNNEIDLLLRRLGRQDTAASDDHLDPDELNSYAENVLPPAARARYTEHLAECVRCRDLVVQLSSSAGVDFATETAKVSEPATLRKFLANLFSPMVLRYAGPALGLVVVAAIGFIVLRKEGTVNYAPVAERREQPQSDQGRVSASEPQTSSSLERDSRGFVDTTKSVNKPAMKGDAGEETATVAPPPPNAPPVVSITTEVQDAAKNVEREQAEAKEAPAPKATPTVQELKKLDAEERKQPEENRVAVANEPAAEKAKTDSNVAELAAASPGRARSRDQRGLTALGTGATTKREREDAAEKDQDEAVIRTVAGRRFRKQGNVWIDTDHSSSRVVTSVTRGSEQYRALVADEPAIKQIADTLDGEIVVVWKGRAYRIH